jgi:hypothetical protein
VAEGLGVVWIFANNNSTSQDIAGHDLHVKGRTNTGWYDAFREWAHERPITRGILCTAFTLFFAWFAFGEMKESAFHPFGSLLWAAVSCFSAFHYFKFAYQRRVNSK